jgi:hypothetical protein
MPSFAFSNCAAIIAAVQPPDAHPMNRRAKSVESEEPKKSQDVALREEDEDFSNPRQLPKAS